MAQTLNASLAAAQALQSRRPLCRILSKENVNPIPFVGERLSSSTDNESRPAVKAHSTGRMFVAFMVDQAADVLRYGYTDTSRTYFTYVDFSLGSGRVGENVSFCELADTYVGLVWSETSGGTRSIKYRKITVTGLDTTPAATTGTIFSQSTSLTFSGPSVATLSDDTYLLAYALIDGTDYKLYQRTSSNFTSWSAASEVTLSGLTATNRKSNPALLAFNSGTVWLLFDYVESTGPNGEELTNIYYVSSDDKLVTPSAPAALTAYTDYAERAEHPAAALSATGLAYVAFDRVVASLRMDKDSTGWCGTSHSMVTNMHIDVTNQKIYAVSTWAGSGAKTLNCVVKIDLATWSIDDCWSLSSAPAFDAYFGGGMGVSWNDRFKGDGAFVPVGNTEGHIAVLNADTDTITTYSFYANSTYGLAQNVTWTAPPAYFDYTLVAGQVDAATSRLYLLLANDYLYSPYLLVGYIDLTEAGPTYAFTQVLADNTGFGHYDIGFGLGQDCGWFQVVSDDDLIIVGLGGSSSGFINNGQLRVYTLSTGGLWKNYNVTSNPTFPKFGLNRGIYNDGVIAGSFEYTALYGQADYRGLCLIDLASDVVTYNRPTWASIDDYKLLNFCLTDTGEYIIGAMTYGVTLFDGTAWTLFDNASLPGLTPTGEENFYGPVIYNPTTRMIMGGHYWYGGLWQGLVMFSRDGYIRQSTYVIGTPNGSWSWSTAEPLVVGYNDYSAALAFDPVDDALYAFWTSALGTDTSIEWDKALSEFDLSSYLLRGSAVERSSAIDPHSGSWDAGLSFEVSHGHLFDASNTASLLRSYLAKGRLIEQQFGEEVGGVAIWEAARHFTVSDDGELVYERGQYPTMQVECETPRRRWREIHIVASEAFTSAYPEDIIATLLEDYASEASANISLGTWANRAQIDYQFVDVMLGDAVDQIAWHFGYAIRDGAGGIIQAVKITDEGSIARTYSDNSKLLRATPRNRYSSFTNRWTVQCEERTFTELLMQETLAAELMASHRWNTGEKTYRVYYTQGEKIYRNLRLEVLSSVASLAFQLAGSCSEELLDNSHDEADQALWDTYCEIVVSSPDLTPLFLAALAGLIASYWAPDVLNISAEITIPVGKYAALTAIFLALSILAATGNFQYRVYGQPVVKVRRTVQATADDTDMQVKMGQVIADTPFVDPLCGSAGECQAVADFLKMVGMAERARWSAERVADLHDEEGDTISVVHPFSGQAVSVFLTDLKSTFLMPEDASGAGGLTQEIEGWRL